MNNDLITIEDDLIVVAYYLYMCEVSYRVDNCNLIRHYHQQYCRCTYVGMHLRMYPLRKRFCMYTKYKSLCDLLLYYTHVGKYVGRWLFSYRDKSIFFVPTADLSIPIYIPMIYLKFGQHLVTIVFHDCILIGIILWTVTIRVFLLEFKIHIIGKYV